MQNESNRDDFFPKTVRAERDATSQAIVLARKAGFDTPSA
jgi:hypothetical protein